MGIMERREQEKKSCFQMKHILRFMNTDRCSTWIYGPKIRLPTLIDSQIVCDNLYEHDALVSTCKRLFGLLGAAEPYSYPGLQAFKGLNSFQHSGVIPKVAFSMTPNAITLHKNMLTPKFEVQQDETCVTVKIFAPYAQITDAEISITEEVFTFYSSPYYLRHGDKKFQVEGMLGESFAVGADIRQGCSHSRGKLVDSELEEYSAKFDADAGAFIITCKKEIPGEHFTNLDLLTMLLAPQGATGVNRPSVEVIGGNDSEKDEEEDFDFTCEQTLPEENIVTMGYKYGFGNNSTGVFSVLQSELKDVVDISDPDNKSAPQRREERITQEMSLFDEDHYLADYFDVDMTQQFTEFIPEFYSITSDEAPATYTPPALSRRWHHPHKYSVSLVPTLGHSVEFSEQDKQDMLELPRKEHLLDKGTKSMAFLGLADILYAWCYNHRITLGENNVESAWNVAKLSSTLSWLDSFTSLKDVAVSSIRRSLTFPLVRNWLLAQQVLKDTAHVLSLGRKKVLKCLFEIRRFFSASEPRYILNQLYINDYCVWLQKVKENKFISLGDSLRKVRVLKADVGLDLDDLETAAHLVLKEEEETLTPEQNINNIVTDMAGMTIIENGAVLGVSSDEALLHELPDNNTEQRDLVNLSDSDSSSSDSDSEEESDDTSDSSDSSDDSSDDSDGESSSDSSDLDSDDDTLSENDDN
ncbi:protein SHQ1 homolog [Scylla paramamosain]|uniref:protein SHQ1 homolog n=1 Tax=Scylla paramamosain TaxID=85552 RepID=UPI00308357D7